MEDDLFSLISDCVRASDLDQGEQATIGNPWIAASLLQKAIRRGEQHWAQIAALSLLRIDPNRLWRRLEVIATEDVGLGDLDTVALTTGGLAYRKKLIALHGSERTAVAFTGVLCRSAKCRATDDLYSVIELGSKWETARAELGEYSGRDLAELTISGEAIELRAIATRYLLGTEWPRTSAFRSRKGAPSAFFDYMLERGCPETLVRLARENYRQTRVALSALLLILHQVHGRECVGQSPVFETRPLTAAATTETPPLWALDGFTREGKAALHRLLTADSELQHWMRHHIPAKLQMAALGNALFNIEGRLVDRQLVWPTGEYLRRQAMLGIFNVSETDAAELLTMLADRLPRLDAIRHEMLSGARSA